MHLTTRLHRVVCPYQLDIVVRDEELKMCILVEFTCTFTVIDIVILWLVITRAAHKGGNWDIFPQGPEAPGGPSRAP